MGLTTGIFIVLGLYSGFIARISLDVGVPMTFIISTSWSTALLPGNIGSHRIVSAITQATIIIILFGCYGGVGVWIDFSCGDI